MLHCVMYFLAQFLLFKIGLKRLTYTLDGVLMLNWSIAFGKDKILREKVGGTAATHQIPFQLIQFLFLRTKNKLDTFNQLLLRLKMGISPQFYQINPGYIEERPFLLITAECCKLSETLNFMLKCFISTLSFSWYLLLWKGKDE